MSDLLTPSANDVKQRRPAADLVAGVICLGGSFGFLMMAWALPPGHSVGDVGPGALPVQIGIFGIVCAIAYLLIALQGKLAEEPATFASTHRALIGLILFVVALLTVPWLGLAIAIAIAAGLTTLLFSGPHRLMRAVATGMGLWLIAVLLFQNLLGLPLP